MIDMDQIPQILSQKNNVTEETVLEAIAKWIDEEQKNKVSLMSEFTNNADKNKS